MASKICELLPCLLLIAILFSVDARREFEQSCNVPARLAKKLFSSTEEVHNSSRTDNTLLICSKNNTCCTRQIERKFQRISERVRVSLSSQLQDYITYAFSNASKNFTGFFQGLIENTYKDLDKLYSRTYVERYTNHKAIFRHFFTKLGKYMKETVETDLKQVIDSWFSLLYQKVYMISNENAIFSASYQHCILETADSIRPFGDISRKIGVQIKKSFLASKVLVEALDSANKVVNELLSMRTHEKCVEAFMKMTHCGFCSNVDFNVKPCHSYCMNVMKGCSAYPAVVNPSWNTFLNALTKLAIKVDGPFSMEAVLRPLGVEISDGIMLFQARSANITARVQKQCGIPPRKAIVPIKRRSLRGEDMSFPFSFGSNDNDMVRPTTAYGTSLDRLIAKVKNIISKVKNHWVELPHNVCSKGLAASPTEKDKCWNGDSVSSYTKPIVKDGIEGMFQNPEVQLNISDPHLTVTLQVIKLKEITQRILSAISGSDSKEFDLEGSGESSGEGSGGESGSGAGSGKEPTTWPDTAATTSTESINTNIDDRTTPYPTQTTTMSNEIPQPGDEFDRNNQVNDARTENAVGRPPGNSASLAAGNILVSIFTFAFTGLLLL